MKGRIYIVVSYLTSYLYKLYYIFNHIYMYILLLNILEEEADITWINLDDIFLIMVNNPWIYTDI